MIYKMADLYVKMTAQYNKLQKQAEPYLSNTDAKPDITINVPFSEIEKFHAENPHLSMENCEYLLLGGEFYNQLINFNGFLLHGSAVALNGEVYIFTASPGVGKSTHTNLWLKYFGEKAQIINDDKPAIRIIDDKIYAFGTPFSGKFDISKNVKLPIKAIAVIERGEGDSITRISAKESYFELLNQTIRPIDEISFSKVFDVLQIVVNRIPIYRFKATISEQAVKVAYEGMNTL